MGNCVAAATYSPTHGSHAGPFSPLAALAWETVWAGVAGAEKTKPDGISPVGLSRYYCRQRPTLPHSFPCSTIGGSKLNFRVRNGHGCDPAPMTTGMLGAWGPLARARRLAPRKWLAPAVVPDNVKELFTIRHQVKSKNDTPSHVT